MLIAMLLAQASPVPPPAAGARIWSAADYPVAVERRSGAAAASPPGPEGVDHYPVAALRNGEQGRVVAGVAVGVDGRGKRCWIIESSGSPTLDAQTCRIAVTRVTWKPALDQAGAPIESRVRFPIDWRLPE